MSVLAALAAGTAIGVRHSLEPDHVAAVATLVDDDTEREGLVGTSWGIGHSIPIALVALAFLLAGQRLPDVVPTVFELLAGAVLIYLGARMLYRLVEVTEHSHDGHTHTHVSLGSLSLGATHSHRADESFLVGIVHGLAGSGAFVVILVSTAPTVGTGLVLLAAFCVASVATMGALSLLWGRVLDAGARKLLQGGAAFVSLAIGTSLILGEVGVDVSRVADVLFLVV
jgi:cytochrome c biogenesis protein CcdA